MVKVMIRFGENTSTYLTLMNAKYANPLGMNPYEIN